MTALLHKGETARAWPPLSTIRSPFNATRRNSRVVPRPCTLETAKAAEMTSNLDRGPLTTPKPLPTYHATTVPPRYHSAPKQLSPMKPTGPALRALCTGGHQSPRAPNKLDWGPLPPQRRCSLHADRATAAHPNQQGPPKQRGSRSKRGAFTATSSCRHSPFLPRFYPIFTPFCSVIFTPILPRFYPTCEG